MSLLFEAIRVKENKLQNIEYHNRRLNFSRKMLFGSNNFIYLEKYISVPDELDDGIYKCRVEYGKYIEKVEFVPYKQRSVQSLKIIKNNEIDYPYKFTDRTELEQLFLLKGDCDDILIVRMEQITDTSFSNVIFQTSKGSWITPSNPLLKGTKREFLIDQGFITAEKIKYSDVNNFRKAKLINSMLDINDDNYIKIENIKT
jgi:4-amino-4-deoxychorismate lyase